MEVSELSQRRSGRVIERTLDGETVVYDLDGDRITHLDAATAAVWQACDGRTDVEGVAAATGQTRAQVADALVRLDDAGLLASGLSRRQLLARAGAVAWAVPLISIAAPAAAAAASPTAPTVSTFTHCCNGAHTERFEVTVTGLPAGTSVLTCQFSPGGTRTASVDTTTGTAVFSYSFPRTGQPVSSRTLTVQSITLQDGTTVPLSGSYRGGCPGRQC